MIAGLALGLALGACTGGWPGWDEFYAPAPEGEQLGWTASVQEASNQSETDGPGVHPAASAVTTYLRGYRVGGGDQLRVTVFGQDDLSKDYNVDSTGRMSMPLLSSFSVKGMTAQQIEEMIEAKLRRDFLRNPDVSVEVVEYRPVFILGEVTAAGQYPYIADMTIQKAIAVGGGYTARADQGRVIVTRQTGNGPVSMKLSPTAAVLPGDTIYVRERWF